MRQFTSDALTGVLSATGVKISMDGRGRWLGNVFVERLWRSLKHEDIYLKGYANGGEAKVGSVAWFPFWRRRHDGRPRRHNRVRPHQALGNRTPMARCTAVDMTLRLDNARALPTSPQLPQQRKVLSTR